MIRPFRPSEAAIAATLAAAAGNTGSAGAFSFPEVGATARERGGGLGVDPQRYTIDRRRFALGRGEVLFERASRALLAWRHFEIAWLTLHGGRETVHGGQTVATTTRVFGLWFVNPCRVVYVEHESDPRREVAFAYGTLEGHVARGEERFVVRLERKSEEVVFEIVAFSQPAIWLTRLGRPWMRRIQRRFALDAAAALARASNAPPPRELADGSGSHPVPR